MPGTWPCGVRHFETGKGGLASPARAAGVPRDCRAVPLFAPTAPQSPGPAALLLLDGCSVFDPGGSGFQGGACRGACLQTRGGGALNPRLVCPQDDIIDDVESFVAAAEILKERGAYKIYVMATHGILSAEAPRLIEESSIDEVCPAARGPGIGP